MSGGLSRFIAAKKLVVIDIEGIADKINISETFRGCIRDCHVRKPGVLDQSPAIDCNRVMVGRDQLNSPISESTIAMVLAVPVTSGGLLKRRTSDRP